jgi:hypothetical protein
MTTKEIAEATGRQYRAVQIWASLVSAKNAEVSAKIAEARKTSRAADYTISETCDIIEAGLGKAGFASLRGLKIDLTTVAGFASLRGLKIDFPTVAGFASLRGLKIDLTKANIL